MTHQDLRFGGSPRHGRGPGGSAATNTLAMQPFSVVCDEPGAEPEPIHGPWSSWSNQRNGRADYPANVADASADPVKYDGVCGGSDLFGGRRMRFVSIDSRVSRRRAQHEPPSRRVQARESSADTYEHALLRALAKTTPGNETQRRLRERVEVE